MAIVYLLILVLAFPAIAAANQNLAVAVGSDPLFTSSTTNSAAARVFAANDPIYNQSTPRTIEFTKAYNLKAANDSTFQTNITRTAVVDTSKVGKVMASFAKALPPVSMALSTVDLICTLSSICNVNNEWVKQDSMTTQQANEYIASTFGTWTIAGHIKYNVDLYTAVQLVYNPPSGWWLSHMLWYPSGSGGFMVFKIRNSSGGYYLEGITASLTSGAVTVPKTNVPATDQHWATAETALNTNTVADALHTEAQPLPVTPVPFAPISIPMTKSDTVTRDAAGNATGTQIKTRNLEVEDISTATDPNLVRVQETETVTNYDLNGQPAGSTQTKTEVSTVAGGQTAPPQPPTPTDYTVELDHVANNDTLPRVDIDPSSDSDPWGGPAQCPAPIPLDLNFWSGEIPTGPICDYVEGLNPFILLLASLTAAFIITGARVGGSES